MDCRKAERFISEWSGGEMTPEVRTHIASCDHCRAEMDEASACLDSLRVIKPGEPPEGFWGLQRARVRAAIESELQSPDRGIKDLSILLLRPRVIVPVAMVLVLLVAAGIAGNWFNGPSGTTETRLAALEDVVQAPLTMELVESNAELSIEVDEEESAIISMAIGSDYGSGDIYFDIYGLEDEELELLYNSLGRMEEQFSNAPDA